jgi:hypothetical protein
MQAGERDNSVAKAPEPVHKYPFNALVALLGIRILHHALSYCQVKRSSEAISRKKPHLAALH